MLKIIIGRSGSGKSQKCITEFNAYIQKYKSINKASYLFVPEQYNMITERRLLEYQINENFTVKGLIGHEVLNFKRFVHRVLCIYGHSDDIMLNDCGKIMLLTSVINNIKNRLLFYNNITERYSEIARILSLIDEFAKYNVSYKEIRNLSTGDSYLDKKLHDLSLILEEYELMKENKYSDNNDSFKIMLKLVEKNSFFKGKSVWIDSFTGFTAQELELIKIMISQCDNVTVTLCTDNSGEQAFECIDKTFNCLKTLAENIGSQIFIENLSIKSDSNMFKYNNRSLFYLQENISKVKVDNCCKSNDIYLTECLNIFDEVTNCALNIKRVHNELNIPYKNIAVAVRDTNAYDVIIRSVFQKFDIPFYIDDKKSIDNNPIIKTILGVLAIISEDWQTNDVLEVIKADILPFVKNRDNIENYILSLGLRGNKSYETCEHYEIKSIYNEINSLSKSLGSSENIKNACVILTSYFQKWGIQNKLKKLAEDIEVDYPQIKNEYSRIWNILLEVIEQIVSFLGDIKCFNSKKTSDTLRKLLSSGFSHYKIGFLPGRIDTVQIINIERSRSSQIKALFVLGVNEGVLPFNFSDNGILKDDERDILNKFNINLADSSDIKASKENYYIYTILSLPSDVLEISWPLEDIAGKSLKPSHVILRKIKKIFPNINISLFNNIYNSNEHYIKSHSDFNNNLDVDINCQLLNLNGNLTTTVSRIEDYYICPFSFFINYGLNLKCREVAEISQNDIGNLIHALAENVLYEILKLPNDAPLSEYENLVENAFSNIYESMRFSQYDITQREINLLNRVKRYASKSFMYIKKQIVAGKFQVRDIESSFGFDENSTLKSIVIAPKEKTKYLNSINIIGRIDRYDVFEDETGNQFVRVVDYKTSSYQSKISDEEVKNGVALQLLTYLNAVINTLSDEKNTLPAGALYYTFDNDIGTISNHISFSKISDSYRDKKYSMTGYLLDDDYIIQKMTGDNKYIVSENIIKSNDDFEALKNIVYDNIEKASVNISKGKYPILPYLCKDYVVCDSCKMRSICANSFNLLDESNT